MKNNQIGRRKFIQYSATGIALAASTGSLMASEYITMKQNADKAKLNITSETDVLIVGGGTAGTIAAILAGKLIVSGLVHNVVCCANKSLTVQEEQRWLEF